MCIDFDIFQIFIYLQTMTDVAGNPEEERKADFYFQPWSQEAVCRYFYGKVSHCFQFYFKVNGPHVQTFCIEKNSHMDAI